MSGRWCNGSYVINLAGDKVTLPEEAADASMAPYHVSCAGLNYFVRERGAKATLIHLDAGQIEANIEHTRVPGSPGVSDTTPLTIFRASCVQRI